MTAKPDTQSISQQYDLPHAPAKVWRALTEPELVSKWLMSNDMKPVVGNTFQFKSDPTPWWDGIVNCEVLEADPPRRLSYTWRSGSEPSPLDTVVTWTLEPTASGGTLLSLEHTGFVPADGYAFDGASKGWKRMLENSLPEVLSKIS